MQICAIISRRAASNFRVFEVCNAVLNLCNIWDTALCSFYWWVIVSSCVLFLALYIWAGSAQQDDPLPNVDLQNNPWDMKKEHYRKSLCVCLGIVCFAPDAAEQQLEADDHDCDIYAEWFTSFISAQRGCIHALLTENHSLYTTTATWELVMSWQQNSQMSTLCIVISNVFILWSSIKCQAQTSHPMQL